MITPRRALIGNSVELPDGRMALITGINIDDGLAAVVIGGQIVMTVPQDLFIVKSQGVYALKESR